MENEEQKQENKQENKNETALAPIAMGKNGLQPRTMEEVWRFANAISRCSFVTPEYKGNPDNCFILLDLSARIGTPWIMLMQHLYVVHNRPALDSAITTALVNQSGQFVDPLEYEVEGEKPFDKDFKVRAYATRKSTGKVLYGPWIDWAIVKAEGWDSKAGSKWKSMPDQMFHYRAASWFQRRFCPELTMGMITSEEILESPESERKIVESTEIEPPKKGVAGLRDKLSAQKEKEKEIEQNAADKFGTPEEIEAGKKKMKKIKKAKKVTKQEPKKEAEIAEIKDKEGEEKYKHTCLHCGEGYNEPSKNSEGKELCPNCLKRIN